MAGAGVQVVTGAFGYSGRYIAKRLLNAGVEVRTLTNSPHRENDFDGKVTAHPLSFDDHKQLVSALRGASVLYNTYWVRFNHADFAHATAVSNTLKLFEAAKDAGVQRVVHVSITNPDEHSPFEYFRGKGLLERKLIESGLSHAILRPAVLFGGEDVLINNIAWMLRRLPVFGVFGDGLYRLQPIHVDDFAALAIDAAATGENTIIDAIGPETFTYRELIERIGQLIASPRPIMSVSPAFGYAAGWVLGKLMRDVVITREEIGGLMADLLCTDSAPVGKIRLTDWAADCADELGTNYASELARRRNRRIAYGRL